MNNKLSIDNFEQIKKLLEFRSKDDFYFLQIIQRKKDVKPNDIKKVEGPNNNSRLIKMYQITSVEKLEKVKKEVIALCDLFNARAGIELNRKSLRSTSLQTARLIMDQFINENYKDAIKAYSSVCGRYSNESDKKWIIDIDEPLGRKHNEMILFIERECKPKGLKFITTIPSKSGVHIITKPFDVQKFKENYPNIDIQKSNPTNLYIP